MTEFQDNNQWHSIKTYNQKRLGVLGGMGPASTAEFLRLLAYKAPAENDQQHPIVYLISDPQIPDRSSAISGNGKDPSENIKKDLFKLINIGADILTVPCNTAHHFIDMFRDDLPVPLIHIVKETIELSKIKSPNGCWLISSIGTRNCGLYQRYAEKSDYQLFIPNDHEAEMVHNVAELIKAGNLNKSKDLANEIIQTLQNIRNIPFMVACTEFPLAYNALGLPQDNMISCLDALSDACIRELYTKTI